MTIVDYLMRELLKKKISTKELCRQKSYMSEQCRATRCNAAGSKLTRVVMWMRTSTTSTIESSAVCSTRKYVKVVDFGISLGCGDRD